MRIVIGWTFLWAFLDKTFGLGFVTTAEEVWLRGEAVAQGYFEFAVYEPACHSEETPKQGEHNDQHNRLYRSHGPF